MENVSQNSMASENSSSMFTDSCELSEAESTTREIPDLPQSLEFLDSDVKSLPNYLLKVRNPIKKKNQNRKAAMKYRCKKKSEVTAIGDKLNELKTREKVSMLFRQYFYLYQKKACRKVQLENCVFVEL